jgi:rhamnosyltransferase
MECEMSEPTVAVLMSTYNGERFIRQQVESILAQEDVKIHLFVRDDGSTDGTLQELRSIQESNISSIDLEVGVNQGYAKSFLNLLVDVPSDYDFFAFSDQDDVWLPDKIRVALERQNNDSSRSWIYTSALEYVDEQLHFIRTRNYPNKEVTLPSLFARMRFAGCTMVFPRVIKQGSAKLASQYFDEISVPHDQFVMAVCLANGGVIDVDHVPHIKYRRSVEAVTAGGKSWMSRLGYEIKRIRKNDSLDILAGILLESSLATSQYANYLSVCKRYKSNAQAKGRLLHKVLGSSGNAVLDMEAMIKVMISTF